jgi:hypothetical protein
LSPDQKAHVENMLFNSYLGLRVLRTICKRLGLDAAGEAADQTIEAIGSAYPAFAARSSLRAGVSEALPLQKYGQHRVDDGSRSDDPTLRVGSVPPTPAPAAGVTEGIFKNVFHAVQPYLNPVASFSEVMDAIRAALSAPAPAATLRPETEAEHIARDMREGVFPARSERQQVPVWKSTDAMRDRARELATPPRDDFDRAVLAILDDFDRLQASAVAQQVDDAVKLQVDCVDAPAAPADGLVERLRIGTPENPKHEVVWVQNLREHLRSGMFSRSHFPEWCDIFLANFNTLLEAAGEAATALASAEARAEKWKSACMEAREGCNQRSATIRSLRSKRETAEARADRLEKALEPFAAVADEFSDAEDDTFEVWRDFNIPEIREASKLKHFRRARTLTGKERT